MADWWARGVALAGVGVAVANFLLARRRQRPSIALRANGFHPFRTSASNLPTGRTVEAAYFRVATSVPVTVATVGLFTSRRRPLDWGTLLVHASNNGTAEFHTETPFHLGTGTVEFQFTSYEAPPLADRAKWVRLRIETAQRDVYWSNRLEPETAFSRSQEETDT